MIRLSQRIGKIKPSATLAVTFKAKELKASGIDVIGFGAGEPDFDTPEHIKEAAIKAINRGMTKYTPTGGVDELKQAIVQKLRNENGLEYQTDEIIVSCGAKHSLYNLSQVLFQEGDDVLIIAPYWVSYPEQVNLADANPIIIQTNPEDNFKLKPDVLEKAITSKARAIILNSPSNPTGMAYSRDELSKLADVLSKHSEILIISDEIYERLVYDGFSHISIASVDKTLKERTVVVNGLSKSCSMTGWRIGYAAGPKEIINAMNKIQSQSTSNPTSISQAASIEALIGLQDEVGNMRKEFEERRNYIVDRLNQISGISCLRPQGAFYVFPDIKDYFGRIYDGQRVENSSDFSMFLMNEARVAVVPGIAFGNDKHIRLSYATSMENIKEGMNRMEEALKRLE